MSTSDDFYAINLATIEAYVAERREEDLHLDFKKIADAKLARDDRKSLAIVVSGFANSEGGIVVWGVDARPNAQGIDCATGLNEIGNVHLCLTKLNEFTGQCVSPLVDGVIHRAIPTIGGAGFCLSLIPTSDAGPHMAKGGEDRYYKRSGSAFYRLEHFDLADLFGRRPKPMLQLSHRIVTGGVSSSSAGKEYGGALILGLANTGRGLAHFAYLTVRVEPPYKVSQWGLDESGKEGLPRLASQDGTVHRYGAGADVVIHPGVVHDVTKVKLGIPVDNTGALQPVPDVRVHCEYTAEGVGLTPRDIVVAGSELVALLLPGGEASA